MSTCVVAKQGKTTKVKNIFVNGKKKLKRILSCLFGGRRKAQFRRKKLEPAVGTPLEFAVFRGGFDAKYSKASAFVFFCPQP